MNIENTVVDCTNSVTFEFNCVVCCVTDVRETFLSARGEYRGGWRDASPPTSVGLSTFVCKIASKIECQVCNSIQFSPYTI